MELREDIDTVIQPGMVSIKYGIKSYIAQEIPQPRIPPTLPPPGGFYGADDHSCRGKARGRYDSILVIIHILVIIVIFTIALFIISRVGH